MKCYNIGVSYFIGGIKWKSLSVDLPREANFLKLDCSKIKSVFGWSPRWNIKTAIEKTVEWTKTYQNKGNLVECMEKQINNFLEVD